ncbi:MAG: hypothetical protein A3D28_03250 [Omnitrophica bacterium RIFCSPHIGHO2_02_FULL_63_14]|nr:MAG: hypothetical protein A3D28_03250 [Omnitrophica bacterium RIFCSPHIGHO2_02_FULL_63_14]
MSNIFRREIGSYFNSAIAYIFVIVFVVFANGLFMLQFFQIGKADMRLFFNSLPFALIIFIPAISMRLWAEEKRTATYELLLTFPMRPHELVLGKYLASLFFYLFALASTLTIPVMIALVGKADPGPVIGGYLGVFLLGGFFLAIGIFLSGLCKDQIVAFIVTMIVTFALYFVGTDLFAVFLDGWVAGAGTFLKNNLGMAGRLVDFGRGVIDLVDIVYFVLAIGALLFLNGLSLEGRYRPKARLVFSAAVAVVTLSVVLVNWLIQDVRIGRWDVTEARVHTISENSVKVLKGLKVPVRVKYYVSAREGMPTMLKSLEQEVSDKLEALRAASGDKVQWSVVRLESVPDEKDPMRRTLQNQGVTPFQVESVQRDEVGVKLIFSTLVLEYKEKPLEIIPRVLPGSLQDTEYQILSRVFKMTLEERPKIAMVAPLKENELTPELTKVLEAAGQKGERLYEDDYKTAAALLRNNGYDVRRVALTKGDPIPAQTNMLLVLKPGKLSERQRFEIGRYLTEGGTVVVAAQGFEYTFERGDKGIEAKPEKLPLDVNGLIEKWGVKVSPDVLFDEDSQVIALTTGQRIGPFALEMPIQFPNQINVRESSLNRSAAVMDRVPSLAYLWGSALDLSPDVFQQQGLKSTVLFHSSPRSWKSPNEGTTKLTQENTRPPAAGSPGKFPLGVLLEGPFQNPLGTAAPPWKEGETAEVYPTQGEPKPGRLLVIGCSQIFAENLIQNPGNINFFANIVDGYTLGEDLLKIRSKSIVVRDIRKVSNIEKVWYKFFTLVLVPLALAVAAIGRSLLRRKEKEFYMAALKAR